MQKSHLNVGCKLLFKDLHLKICSKANNMDTKAECKGEKHYYKECTNIEQDVKHILKNVQHTIIG